MANGFMLGKERQRDQESVSFPVLGKGLSVFFLVHCRTSEEIGLVQYCLTVFDITVTWCWCI